MLGSAAVSASGQSCTGGRHERVDVAAAGCLTMMHYHVLIFAGVLQVAELDGCPRMGPTFGAMFMSGQKAAHCALNSLRRQRAEEGALPAAEKELVSA